MSADEPTSADPAPPAPEPGDAPGATASRGALRAGEPCPSCGTVLVPYWYFCVGCAAPWRDPGRDFRPTPPPTPTGEQRVRALAPGVLPMVCVYALAIVAVGIFSWFAGGEGVGSQGDFLSLVLGTIVLAVLTCVYGVRHARALRPQLATSGLTSRWGWAALATLPALLAVNWAWHTGITSATGAKLEDPFQGLRERGVSEATLYVLVAAFPALTEEIAFRGLVQHWLQVALEPRHAIWVASGLFTAMHFSIASAPYLFLVGCVLGWAKWKTGSLWPSILLHAGHNAAVLAWLRA